MSPPKATSEFGPKQTCRRAAPMSAFRGKADMPCRAGDVCKNDPKRTLETSTKFFSNLSSVWDHVTRAPVSSAIFLTCATAARPPVVLVSRSSVSSPSSLTGASA